MPSTVASPLPTVMSPGVSSASPATSIVPTITSTIQSLQQKDTTWTKLFVGGLPYHTTDKSLREHFEVYGEIEEAVVITDRSTGKSRGYGFVIMADKEAADRALKEPNPIIDGRKANVNLAILGAKPRGNLTAQLPLTAMRPGFPALLGQYGDLTAGLAGAGQLGLGVPCVTGSPYTMQAAAAASPAVSPGLAAAAAAQAAPGKARSSMNLGLISGRQPVAAQTAASPYIQQLYAASASPYGQVQPNMMQLMAGGGGVTGNPLLDMYTQQYAAALGYPAAAQAGGVAVSAGGPGVQLQPPVSQSLSLDQASQAQAQAQAVAGSYFGFYAPQALTAQQLTAAGLTAAQGGLPAAYASAPAAATTPTGAGQAQPAETRTQ